MRNKSLPFHMAGKIITLVQLILALVLAGFAWSTKLIPMKYVILLAVILLMLFAITFGLQFIRSKLYIFGVILSIIISLAQIVGLLAVAKANKAIDNVGGADFKTTNMVVVVKKDDPAENLMDAAYHRFAVQTAVDQDNTEKMLDDINTKLGKEVKVEEYKTVQEEAEALLKGRIDAAIYNEALTDIIEESIEGYSDKVRVLYRFGIDTKLETKETNLEEPFNIYISGIDVAGPITSNSRSDVNIIMTVNPNTRHILLSTTPRDYYVEIPGISNGQKDKLTHAGIYGVDASMKTLEKLYGIEMSYYVRVNFTSLIKIVDALGGVDVKSEVAFTTKHGSFQIKKGMNHLDGETALGFSRERYSFADGDNQRGKNQEAVLTAILKKAMSPAVLTAADEILTDVGDCVQTNMTSDEMKKFINRQLDDPKSWKIESVAVSGSNDRQACFSSGSQILYVMQPEMASVKVVSNKMQSILEEK